MPWGAAIAAVGTIGAAAINSSAAGGAAGQQIGGANNASATELGILAQNEANLSPFIGAGTNALNIIQQLTGTNPAIAAGTLQGAKTPVPGSGNAEGSGSTFTLNGEQYFVPYSIGAGFTPQSPGVADLGAVPVGFNGTTANPGTPAGNPLTAPATKPFDTAGFNAAFNASLANPGSGAPGADPTAGLNGAYAIDPSFNFNLLQGSNAIANRAAATGGVNSGNALKALQTFGQGLLSNQYNTDLTNSYNMNNSSQQQLINALMGISNTGLSAANSQANTSTAVGGQVGSNQIGAGNSAAAGTIGNANALSGGLNGLSSAALLAYLNGGAGTGTSSGGGYDFTGGGLFGYGNTNMTYNQLINGA